MKTYDIDEMKEIANGIRTGELVKNSVGSVIDGFFWFPDEMEWAEEWKKDTHADDMYGYFAMLLDPDIFDDEEDDDEIMAGIEYWWHRSQIYSASFILNNMPEQSLDNKDVAQTSLMQLLNMQREVKAAFKEEGLNVGPDAQPKDIWRVIRTTAQHIHNNVRGNH